MKSGIIRGLALVICGILGAAAFVPVKAEPAANSGNSAYQDKNAAFFKQQTNVEGRYNGDAVYDCDIPQGSVIVSGDVGPYKYGEPVYALIDYDGSFCFCNSIVFNPPQDPNSDIAACYASRAVYPDLYGYFDFANTPIKYLNTPLDGQTHITGVDMSDCFALRTLTFCGQAYCTELRAVNTPQLRNIIARYCDYKFIEIQPFGFKEPSSISVFGDGELGLIYDADSVVGSADAYAMRGSDGSGGRFYGWYVNGQLVGESGRFTLLPGVNATACFAGDADGSRTVDLSDAIAALRSTMGLGVEAGGVSDSADIDGDGTVSADDALCILRFTMGL